VIVSLRRLRPLIVSGSLNVGPEDVMTFMGGESAEEDIVEELALVEEVNPLVPPPVALI
jgi:hypothetical protein